MSYFRDIVLLKAPQAFDIPHPGDVSDLTEICYLAAVVENDVNSVSIPVDFYSKNPYMTFVRFLKRSPVDLVAISSMTGAFSNALKLAEIAKSFDKYVVMGGYHPTALPDDALKSPYVDAVVIGEGELTFKDLVLNGPSKDIAGIAFKENGSMVTTGCRPLIKDLDSLPNPLRRIRPTRFDEPGVDYSIDTIYTSRGCPWTCTFCANDIINKQWRARSPENVIEEIAKIHDPKRKKLLKIWDANFLTNIKRVEKLCDLMLENNLTNFKIWTETRVDDIVRAEGIMDKLYRVGLRHISLGIESPNEKTLKLMNKKNKDDACIKAIEILNRHKIKPQGYFIIGHYAETVEDTKKYPEYAESLGLRHSIFMVMTPYPGTAIYNEFKHENKIINFNWDLYNNFGTVVETKGMDIKTLKKMYAWCWGKFYIKFGFFNQKRPLGFATYLIQQLSMIYTMFKADKDNTREEIEDYLFEFLNAGIGGYTRDIPMKPSWLLNTFGDFTIRFRHSKGKNIDLIISQYKGKRHLHVKKSHGSGLIKGISIDLDKIMKLGNHITSNRAVALASKSEIARNLKGNTKLRFKKKLSFVIDKDFASPVLFFGNFMFPVLLKGAVSTFLASLLSPPSKIKMPK